VFWRNLYIFNVNKFSARQELTRVLQKSRNLYRVPKSNTCPYMSQLNPFDILLLPLKCLNNIRLSTSGIPDILFSSHFTFLCRNTACILSSPLACHVLHQFYPPYFNYPNIIWQREHLMKFLIVKYFSLSCYFIPLKPKYLP